MAAKKKMVVVKTPNPDRAHREPTECYDDFLLADDEDWLAFLEPLLCKNAGAAEDFARLLNVIRNAIQSGPEGIARAVFTLSDGIRIAYKYTETHKAALRLYNLSLTGDVAPEDEPLVLISRALRRAGQNQAGTDR